MSRKKLIEILGSFATDQFDNRNDAHRTALRLGRCGSPFSYCVVEAEPDNFMVVTHIEEPMYRRLLEAAQDHENCGEHTIPPDLLRATGVTP